MKPRVSVVIPAYNEQKSIGSVVSSILGSKFADEVIVVNDGSTDETASEARRAGAVVLDHPYNIGNGAAVKSGARAARGDVVVLMDGDGQHPPEDIPRLLEHIPRYDMVVAAREKGTHANLKRRLGNAVFNAFSSYVAQFRIEDLTSGFRAIKRPILMKYLYLLPNAFSYPSTLTLALIRTGRPVRYVAFQAKEARGVSKIRLFHDGTRFFLIIVRIGSLFAPFRVFLPASLVFFILGLSNYIYTFTIKHSFTNMSALLFITSVLIFLMGLLAEMIAQSRLDRTEEEHVLVPGPTDGER